MHLSSLASVSLLAISVASAACGAHATAPLDIHPGLTREQTISSLRARQYCRGNVPPRKTETYQQCRRPGVKIKTSWVVVDYDKDILSQLRRFERYADTSRVAKRWHDLVTMRTERDGPPSTSARERLLEIRGLPVGTVSWAAWYAADSSVLIGVYRLQRTGENDADIVEEIRLNPPK